MHVYTKLQTTTDKGVIPGSIKPVMWWYLWRQSKIISYSCICFFGILDLFCLNLCILWLHFTTLLLV